MARRSSQLSESCRHDWREEPRLKSEDEATTAMRPCRRSRNTMPRHGVGVVLNPDDCTAGSRNTMPLYQQFELREADDLILWKFEKNRKFSVKSLYNALTKNDVGPSHKLIWKSKVPQKIKIFIWLLTNNVVLTKDNLIRRKWSGSPVCQFCDQNETVGHLFFTCPIVKVIWAVIARVVWANNIPTSLAQYWNWCDRWLPAGERYHMWGVSAICWAIWKGRNKACFDGVVIKNPIEILCHAGALMRFWTGLYAEVDKEMLINGVNTMLREATRLLLPKSTAEDRMKRLKSGDDDDDRNL